MYRQVGKTITLRAIIDDDAVKSMPDAKGAVIVTDAFRIQCTPHVTTHIEFHGVGGGGGKDDH